MTAKSIRREKSRDTVFQTTCDYSVSPPLDSRAHQLVSDGSEDPNKLHNTLTPMALSVDIQVQLLASSSSGAVDLLDLFRVPASFALKSGGSNLLQCEELDLEQRQY